MDTVAQHWFHYTSNKPRVVSATIEGKLLAPFPWIFTGLNLLFLITGLLLLAQRRQIVRVEREGSGRYPFFITCLQLVAGYLLANAGFNIFASPSVFRYQVLPLILLFIFTVCGISLFFVTYRIANDKKAECHG